MYPSPVTLGEEWENGIRFENGLKQTVPLCELEAAFVRAPKDPKAWRVHSQARKLLNQTKHIIYYADMCVRDGSKRTMRQALQDLHEDAEAKQQEQITEKGTNANVRTNTSPSLYCTAPLNTSYSSLLVGCKCSQCYKNVSSYRACGACRIVRFEPSLTHMSA